MTHIHKLLLPLPLHHVYPFVIGMLTPLVLGLPLILPFSLGGQQLLHALREGEAGALWHPEAGRETRGSPWRPSRSRPGADRVEIVGTVAHADDARPLPRGSRERARERESA